MKMNENERIGAFVKRTLPILIEGGLSDHELNVLLNKKLSKEVFNMNFPILKLVDESKSERSNRMINGYRRYYSKLTLTINGEKYLLTNDWYEIHVSYYLNWLVGINSHK